MSAQGWGDGEVGAIEPPGSIAQIFQFVDVTVLCAYLMVCQVWKKVWELKQDGMRQQFTNETA